MQNYRSLFLFPEKYPDLIYFDSGATSQKPKQVIQEITSYINDLAANTDRSAYQAARNITNKIEDVRKKVASFINAFSSQEIVFTSGATESIHIAMYAWGLSNFKDGDEVILALDDHHSLIGPWLYLKTLLLERNVHITIQSVGRSKAGCWDMNDLKQKVNSKTRLVVLTHIHNVYGTKNDVDVIRNIVGKDTVICLDCSQSVGHISVDVQLLGADIVVFSGHKMFALTGIGVLWIHSRLHSQLKPVIIGGGMIQKINNDYTFDYKPMPYLLESGTKNSIGIVSLGSAIDVIKHIGTEHIHSYIVNLTQYFIQQLRQFEAVEFLPGAAFSQCAVGYGIVSFKIKKLSSHDGGFILSQHNICVRTGAHCTSNSKDYNDSIRVSLHIYNTKEEIDIFITMISKIVSLI